MAWLHSPTVFETVAATRNEYVVAGVRPVSIVLASGVAGAFVHVLPPSALCGGPPTRRERHERIEVSDYFRKKRAPP